MRDWQAVVDHCKDKHGIVLDLDPQAGLTVPPIKCHACGRRVRNQLALEDHYRDKHSEEGHEGGAVAATTAKMTQQQRQQGNSKRSPSKNQPKRKTLLLGDSDLLAVANGIPQASKRQRQTMGMCMCCGSNLHLDDKCPNKNRACSVCGKASRLHSDYYCFTVRLPSPVVPAQRLQRSSPISNRASSPAEGLEA
jgi:hypothetical protein